MYKVKLYYLKGILHLVSITIKGKKHFTADVRNTLNELYFVLSNKTLEDNVLNEEDCKELVEYGHYILIEKQIKIDIQEDIYTYCYIHPKFYLVGNL